MRRPLLLLTLSALAFTSGACASRLLHRGSSPAVTNVPAPRNSGSAVTTVRTDESREARKLAKQRERDAKLAAKRTAHGDPAAPALAPVRSEAAAHDSPDGWRARMQQQPAEPYWAYRLALHEAREGRGGAAEELLRSALARDSAYAPALAELSRQLYAQGRHAEAIALLEPVRTQRLTIPRDMRTALLSGLALHQSAVGDDDGARRTLAALGSEAHDGGLPVAAYLAVRGTSADSAARLTADAVRATPGSAAAHNNRGIALLRSGDPDAAASEFERAIALEPSRPGPYYNLAILERWYRLDSDAAARRFRQYWSLSHSDPDSLYAELGRERVTPVAEEGSNR